MTQIICVKEYDNTEKIVYYNDTQDVDKMTYGDVRRALQQENPAGVYDLYRATAYNNARAKVLNSMESSRPIPKTINGIQIAELYAMDVSKRQPLKELQQSVEQAVNSSTADSRPMQVVFNVAGGSGGSGGNVSNVGNPTMTSTNSNPVNTSAAGGTGGAAAAQPPRVGTSRVITGRRKDVVNVDQPVGSRAAGNWLQDIRDKSLTAAAEKYRNVDKLLEYQPLAACTKVDAFAAGKTPLGRSTFRTWLIQNDLRKANGRKFIGRTLNIAFKHITNGVTKPLTTAYADAKKNLVADITSEEEEWVSKVAADGFMKQHFGKTAADFYLNGDNSDDEATEDPNDAVVDNSNNDSGTNAAITVPSVASATSVNKARSTKVAKPVITIDNDPPTMSGADLVVQRRLFDEAQRKHTAHDGSRKRHANAAPSAAKRLRKKNGDKLSADADDEYVPKPTAAAATGAIGTSTSATATAATAVAAAPTAVSATVVPHRAPEATRLTDDDVLNKPDLADGTPIALYFSHITGSGAGAAAARVWQTDDAQPVLQLVEEDQHVRALMCKLVAVNDEPRDRITLRPTIKYDRVLPCASMPYNGILMRVMGSNHERPPRVNSHVLAPFKSRSGLLTDTIYDAVIIKEGNKRQGVTVKYVSDKKVCQIPEESIAVIASGSHPFSQMNDDCE